MNKVFLSIALLFVLVVTTGCNKKNSVSADKGGIVTVDANGVKFKMMKIQAGTFMMGATKEQTGYDPFTEYPAHKVTLTKNYYIGVTEVTEELWTAVMGKNTSEYTVGEAKNLPEMNISWEDCHIFIKRLNSLVGGHFRMPTDAEWEWAARCGVKSQGEAYSGSIYYDNVAWYKDNAEGHPHSVGILQANHLDLYDMSGNVAEWCQDGFTEYKDSDQVDPMFDGDSVKVIRGGSWMDRFKDCRTASRNSANKNSRLNYIGLRLAMDEMK